MVGIDLYGRGFCRPTLEGSVAGGPFRSASTSYLGTQVGTEPLSLEPSSLWNLGQRPSQRSSMSTSHNSAGSGSTSC